MDKKSFSAIQIQGINVQTLLSEVKSIVSNEVTSIVQNELHTLTNGTPQKGVKLLTRQQTAKMLNVSLVTLHNWAKKGILNPYKIGNQVRFKQTEILQALETAQIKKGAHNG